MCECAEVVLLDPIIPLHDKKHKYTIIHVELSGRSEVERGGKESRELAEMARRRLGRDRSQSAECLSWGEAVKQAIRQRGSISAKCASLEEVSCPFIPFPCTDSEESSWCCHSVAIQPHVTVFDNLPQINVRFQ